MGSSKGKGGLLAMALVMIALAGDMACATASNFIGILVEGQGALSSILEASTAIVCHGISDQTEVSLPGKTFYCRSLGGKSVIVANTGHGMINSARTAQQLLFLTPRTPMVVHYSNAGTPNLNRKLGDVLISRQVAHTGIWYWQNLKDNSYKGRAYLKFADYTLGIQPLPYPPVCGPIGNKLNRVWYRDAQIIYSPDNTDAVFWLPTQPSDAAGKVNLTNCADVNGSRKCLSYTPSVVSDGGNGCSSDIFVQNGEYAKFLGRYFSCQAIDRGAAAVALVVRRVPYVPFVSPPSVVSVKTVSNYAGIKSSQEDKQVLKQIGYQNALDVIKAIVA